ncbi:MAG TPA: glycosyltransferase family 1 protein, partial [Lamprocystis sp. (in: g-proteobacteria)]|nr:glycosyltransferase family 1 protein [Lamprocystis sp. (in: g-proteobacteria)]
ISESSRHDILKRWPALEHKLTVIPHGIGDEYFTAMEGALPTALSARLGASPYLVYLGGSLKRKRFDWALRVLAAADRSDLHLVACGFDQASRAQAARALPDLQRGRVHFAPFLSNTELFALYRGARAVLYPTLYEGFGFPAVEAQAAGTPVLFSALGSLAELTGPLAFLVDPYDIGAWTSALQDALALGERRADLARAALVWTQRFSWQQSVEQHLAVYRQAIGDHAGPDAA